MNSRGVDLRALWASEKSRRRSHELSGGGCNPVPDPMPAVPRPIPGLRIFASVSGVGLSSGRAALARVGLAGSFGFLGGDFAIASNMGRVLWRGKGRTRAAAQCQVVTIQSGEEAMSGTTMTRRVLLAGLRRLRPQLLADARRAPSTSD